MCGGTELELFLQNEEGGGIMSTLRISRPVSQASASGWGGSITLALLLPQGGQTISDISASVNAGSQEKLFTTEATARYEIWDALPSA